MRNLYRRVKAVTRRGVSWRAFPATNLPFLRLSVLYLYQAERIL